MRSGTIRAGIEASKVANIIIAGLEGGMLISRIERNDGALRAALEHLDFYLESQVRKPTAKKSQ
jgi:TetR/AcrR family transcriptional repressor of nem operon